jgi:hypothetical protein
VFVQHLLEITPGRPGKTRKGVGSALRSISEKIAFPFSDGAFDPTLKQYNRGRSLSPKFDDNGGAARSDGSSTPYYFRAFGSD